MPPFARIAISCIKIQVMWYQLRQHRILIISRNAASSSSATTSVASVLLSSFFLPRSLEEISGTLLIVFSATIAVCALFCVAVVVFLALLCIVSIVVTDWLTGEPLNATVIVLGGAVNFDEIE